MRFYWNMLFVLIAFATAGATYFTKYQSRALDLELKKTTRAIEERRWEIKILEGELSYRSRPDQIERLARKFLKIRPTQSGQYLTPEKLKTELGKKVRKLPKRKSTPPDMTRLIDKVLERRN